MEPNLIDRKNNAANPLSTRTIMSIEEGNISSENTAWKVVWSRLSGQSGVGQIPAKRPTLYAELIGCSECTSWREEEHCNNRQVCETVCTVGALICVLELKVDKWIKVCTPGADVCRRVCDVIPECRTTRVCESWKNSCAGK